MKFQKKTVNETRVVQASENIILTTELTAENGSVKWFRDGVELKESNKYEMRKDGFSRTLVVKSTESKDSGSYSCQTADDKLEFKVQVKGKAFVQSPEIISAHLCRSQRLFSFSPSMFLFQIQL